MVQVESGSVNLKTGSAYDWKSGDIILKTGDSGVETGNIFLQVTSGVNAKVGSIKLRLNYICIRGT